MARSKLEGPGGNEWPKKKTNKSPSRRLEGKAREEFFRKTDHLVRAAAPMKKHEGHVAPRHSFYGLKDFEWDDVTFAWNCPKRDFGGCFAYELHRQIAARAICYPKPSYSPATVLKIKDAWLAEFRAPWPQLIRTKQISWCARYKTVHALPLGPVGQDPKPAFGGHLYTIKIDWDLTNPELKKRFVETLKKARPSGFDRKQSGGPDVGLTAIAAQRFYDCRGDLPAIAFLRIVSAQAGKSPLFSSQLRLTRAARRYLDQELEFTIGITKSGELRLAQNPASYGRSFLNV